MFGNREASRFARGRVGRGWLGKVLGLLLGAAVFAGAVLVLTAVLLVSGAMAMPGALMFSSAVTAVVAVIVSMLSAYYRNYRILRRSHLARREREARRNVVRLQR